MKDLLLHQTTAILHFLEANDYNKAARSLKKQLKEDNDGMRLPTKLNGRWKWITDHDDDDSSDSDSSSSEDEAPPINRCGARRSITKQQLSNKNDDTSESSCVSDTVSTAAETDSEVEEVPLQRSSNAHRGRPTRNGTCTRQSPSPRKAKTREKFNPLEDPELQRLYAQPLLVESILTPPASPSPTDESPANVTAKEEPAPKQATKKTRPRLKKFISKDDLEVGKPDGDGDDAHSVGAATTGGKMRRRSSVGAAFTRRMPRRVSFSKNANQVHVIKSPEVTEKDKLFYSKNDFERFKMERDLDNLNQLIAETNEAFGLPAR